MAFLQSTYIPGTLILKQVNFKGSTIQRIIYAFALSLVVNYVVVFLLTTIGMYHQWFLISLFVLEIFGLFWLYRDQLKTSITDNLISSWNNFIVSSKNLLTIPSHNSFGSITSISAQILLVVSIILSLGSLWWLVKLFYYNLGTVFDAWDAVVSWNRWAVEWASGAIPLDSRNYPQLIPTNWSLSYVFMGDNSVQFFAKALMPLFSMGLFLLLFDLGVTTKNAGFFLAVVLMQYILKKFLGDGLTNGYVDVAVTFFAFLGLDTIIRAKDFTDDRHEIYMLFFLGAVFVSGAGVSKQAGMYITLIYPVMFYFIILRSKFSHELRVVIKPVASAILISISLAFSWYVYKLIVFSLGLDRPEVADLAQIAAQTHDSTNIIDQVISAFRMFDKYFILFPVIIVGFFFLPPLYRWLIVTIIIPYPLIWSFLASYDTRNLSVFLPVFGLTAALSIKAFFDHSIQLLELMGIRKLKMYIIPGLITVVLVVSSIIFPSAEIKHQQITKQKLIFSASKNELLYAILEKEPTAKILTNYPVRFLPGLEDNQVPFRFDDFQAFLQHIDNPEIHYLMFPNNIDSQINEHITVELQRQNYELIFVDKEWITYTLVRIVQRK